LNPPPSPSLSAEFSRLDWANFHPRAALRCLPAMALALALVFEFHRPAMGIVVASGVFSIGMSSFRQLQGSRLLQMLTTSVGLACAATLGTTVGESHAAAIFGVGLLVFTYGLILIFSENASWIGLQCVIGFLVASAFPAHGWYALLRGALLFLAGILQIGLVLALARTSKHLSLADDFRSFHPGTILRLFPTVVAPALLQEIRHRRSALRYAVRLSLTLMLAVTLARFLHQTNSYWLPMTTLIVMKPDFYRTYTSSVVRVLGTFAAVLFASSVTLLFHPTPLALGFLILLAAWCALASQKLNYGLFTCALTSWIIFLIATAGFPEATLTLNRLVDTALGSALALGSRAIGPRWENAADPRKT
jgi:uncharacterized membrane protein YccC